MWFSRKLLYKYLRLSFVNTKGNIRLMLACHILVRINKISVNHTYKLYVTLHKLNVFSNGQYLEIVHYNKITL